MSSTKLESIAQRLDRGATAAQREARTRGRKFGMVSIRSDNARILAQIVRETIAKRGDRK